MSLTVMQRDIIYRLHRRGVIGGVHKSQEDIIRWFRKDLRGEAKGALDELVKLSFVVTKPSSYGTRHSLNRDRLEDIERIIREHLEDEG